MRAIDILKQLAHAEGFEPRVIAKVTLRERLAKLPDEERTAFFTENTVRPRRVRLAAPGVWVSPHPFARAVYLGLLGCDDPRPVDVAAALGEQHGWKIGIPKDVAEYLLGIGERVLEPKVLLYDQLVRREYPSCGLVLEPADPALLGRNPVAQAITVALAGKDISADGIKRLVATAAAGAVIASPDLRPALEQAVADGQLFGAAEAFARALLEAKAEGYATRAPADWTPPAEPDQEVRVEGWRVLEIEDGQGSYFALTAIVIHNHPYIYDSLSRSSPILWIDEQQGWCRTQSRIYRLGKTAEQVKVEAETRRQQPERDIDGEADF